MPQPRHPGRMILWSAALLAAVLTGSAASVTSGVTSGTRTWGTCPLTSPLGRYFGDTYLGYMSPDQSPDQPTGGHANHFGRYFGDTYLGYMSPDQSPGQSAGGHAS